MMVYGPGQREHKVLPYTIRTLLAGQPAKLGSGTRVLDWVYVDDVVDAFLRAGDAAVTYPQSIDIGSGQSTRIRDLLGLVGELIGRSDLLTFGDRSDPAMEREATADIKDAFFKLGWRPQTSLRDGLLQTIAYYAAQGGFHFPAEDLFRNVLTPASTAFERAS